MLGYSVCVATGLIFTRIRWLGLQVTCYRIERNGRKTLTTVQGLPKKFDQKKILKVLKKKFGKSANTVHSKVGWF